MLITQGNVLEKLKVHPLTQKRADKSGKIISLPMKMDRLQSFSMSCCQASGHARRSAEVPQKSRPGSVAGDPSVGVQLVGDPSMVSAHPSVGALLVGKIGGHCSDREANGSVQRVPRPAGISHPIGEWSSDWADFTHEFDGHGLDASPGYRSGERLLSGELQSLYEHHGIEEAVDDISGAQLDPESVKKARGVEMGFFKDMQVYEKVPRAEQKETGGKIIGTKWIDVNKGDSENPRIRSRLVGKEFRTGPDDALFASTPPLEALRAVISRAATVGPGEEKKEVMVNDVSRAYFYAKCTRCIYIELPKEDPDAHPDFLGRLKLCLYGTRDAALNWQ